MGWAGAEVSSAPVGCGGAVPRGSPGHGALPPFPGLCSRSARGSVSELSPAWAPGGLRVEVHHVWDIPPQGERLCRHQGQEHCQQEVSKFLLLLLQRCGLSLKEWSLLESFLAAPMETVHSRAVPQIRLTVMPAPQTCCQNEPNALCFEAARCWSPESV